MSIKNDDLFMSFKISDTTPDTQIVYVGMYAGTYKAIIAGLNDPQLTITSTESHRLPSFNIPPVPAAAVPVPVVAHRTPAVGQVWQRTMIQPGISARSNIGDEMRMLSDISNNVIRGEVTYKDGTTARFNYLHSALRKHWTYMRG